MNKKLYSYYYLLAVSFALLLTGCGKNDDLRATLEVTTYYQDVKNGPEALYPNVQGYFFYADTVSYALESYDQAIRGELTRKVDGSVLAAQGTGVPSGTGLLSFSNIESENSVIVIYDTETRTYSWRKFELIEGIGRVSSKLRFRRWRAGETYKESNWVVFMPPTE